MEIYADNHYDTTLRVVADIDYQPYSYLDHDGNLIGHDIELINIIANRLHKNVSIQLVDWDQALSMVNSGQADIVLGAEMIGTTETYPNIAISLPVEQDPFVIFGENDIMQISQLYGTRIATVKDGSSHYLLSQYALAKYCTTYSSYTDAFQSVLSGENDYVIARNSIGQFICSKLGTRSIQPMNIPLFSNDICIGISAGQPDLQQQINQEIAVLTKNGTLTSLHDKWLGKYINIHSLYDYYRSNLWLLNVYIGGILLLVVSYCTLYIHEAIRKENELAALASTDALTGLSNRVQIETQLKPLINLKDTDRKHALFMIDIDNFKKVNDTFGHKYGDILLKRFSLELKHCFREDDFISRLGGDEFAVFMKDIPNLSAVTEKAIQLCEMAHTIHLDVDPAFPITISIGIALYPEFGRSFDDLYVHSDLALYMAKRESKNTFVIYGHEECSPIV
jgi:diguanylate cyclase (GGDEF)-like protein